MERQKLGTDSNYYGFLDVNGETQWCTDRTGKSAFICAPSGFGKATDLAVPNLLCSGGPPGSAAPGLFIFDPKGELYAITARQQRKLGKKTFLLNPFNILSDWPHEDMRTCRYNPIASGPAPDHPDFVNHCNGLAEGIFLGNSNGEAFFTDGARTLGSGVIAFVRGLPPDLQNFTAVYRILKSRGDEFLMYAQAMADTGIELAVNAASPYLAKEPTRGAWEILETASGQVNFLAVPGIQYVLDGPSDFSWSDLKRGDTAVYVAMPGAESKRYGRFSRMLVGSGLQSCLAPPRANVCFWLDEVATCMAGQSLTEIEVAVSLGRGYGVALCLFFQSYPQARSVFGRDNVDAIIASCATQCFFTPNDEATAGYIARRAGERTTIDLQYQMEAANPGLEGWQPNGRAIGVPIYRNFDLYGFPRNKMILFREGFANAIETWRAPYFKIPLLAAAANVNPYAPPAAKAVTR